MKILPCVRKGGDAEGKMQGCITDRVDLEVSTEAMWSGYGGTWGRATHTGPSYTAASPDPPQVLLSWKHLPF